MKYFKLIFILFILPAVAIAQADANKVLCLGQTITLTSTETGSIYHWYKVVNGVTQMQAPTTKIYTETPTTPGYYNYQVVVENSAGCISPISFHSIEWLDHQEQGLANFHLLFLVQLSRYLGFHPERNEASTTSYFDLKDGLFTAKRPEHNLFLAPPYTQYFNLLLDRSFDELPEIKLPNDIRRFLLDRLIEYYALHIEGFGQIHSHEVLEEVLG